MTTGELLDQSSSVTQVSALTHLQNLNTGTGVDRWFPYADMEITFEEQDVSVKFDEQNLDIAFEEQDVSVKFEEDILNVTIEEANLDITVTCE